MERSEIKEKNKDKRRYFTFYVVIKALWRVSEKLAYAFFEFATYVFPFVILI